jgi:hypothetical protein
VRDVRRAEPDAAVPATPVPDVEPAVREGAALAGADRHFARDASDMRT